MCYEPPVGAYTTGGDPVTKEGATGWSWAQPGYFTNCRSRANLLVSSGWDVQCEMSARTEQAKCPEGAYIVTNPESGAAGYGGYGCYVATEGYYVADNTIQFDAVPSTPGFIAVGGITVKNYFGPSLDCDNCFSTSQIPCPPGAYSYAASAECISTSAGTYTPSPGTGDANVMICPEGTTSGTGSTFCYVPGTAPTGNYKGSVVKDSVVIE